MKEAGASSTSGAAQKIFLNYLQTVSLAASFPLNWPWTIEVMFNVQSSASSFSDQLMDFDCEMAKSTALNVFYQKQIFFFTLPISLIIINMIYWKIDKWLDKSGICQCCSKKYDEHKKVLKKKRLLQFQSLARSATVQDRASKGDLTMTHALHHAHTIRSKDQAKLRAEIHAYKSIVDSRGDGKTVLCSFAPHAAMLMLPCCHAVPSA